MERLSASVGKVCWARDPLTGSKDLWEAFWSYNCLGWWSTCNGKPLPRPYFKAKKSFANLAPYPISLAHCWLHNNELPWLYPSEHIQPIPYESDSLPNNQHITHKCVPWGIHIILSNSNTLEIPQCSTPNKHVLGASDLPLWLFVRYAVWTSQDWWEGESCTPSSGW